MPRRAQKVSDTVIDQFMHILHKLRHEGRMLLLQRVPLYTAGIPFTTCRHLQCPYEDAIFQAGDFILSLEKPQRCDPSKNPLSYKAVACLSEVLNSGWNHKKGKRGLGEHGEERWHVTCFESLCREVRKRELLINPGDGIPSWAPSMEFGHHIITDERCIPAYPGKFNIDSPYQFGLELWKAVQLFDDRQAHGAHFMPSVPPHIQLPTNLIVGRDGQSLYLTNAAKTFRGKMPWSEIAEISAADVRGVTLDEMTKKVSAMLTPKYQAMRALEKQEELAKRAGKESTEPDEKHPSDEPSSRITQDQPPESTLDASTAPTDGEKLLPTPTGMTAARTAENVPGAIENQTNGRSNDRTPLSLIPPEATSLGNPAPAASEPFRTSPKLKRQSDSVAQEAATGPEKEATGGDAVVADEDDVVFLGRDKVPKLANDPLEEPENGKATGGRETRRSPRGGRGRWRYRYAN